MTIAASQVRKLESPDYRAFKQVQEAKAQSHVALVKEVRRQTRKAVRDQK
jgi:hypothetical protein